MWCGCRAGEGRGSRGVWGESRLEELRSLSWLCCLGPTGTHRGPLMNLHTSSTVSPSGTRWTSSPRPLPLVVGGRSSVWTTLLRSSKTSVSSADTSALHHLRPPGLSSLTVILNEAVKHLAVCSRAATGSQRSASARENETSRAAEDDCCLTDFCSLGDC